MMVRGDIESVNLETGEKFQRVVGDGESRLESLNLLPRRRGKRVWLPPDIGGHRVNPKPTLEQYDKR